MISISYPLSVNIRLTFERFVLLTQISVDSLKAIKIQSTCVLSWRCGKKLWNSKLETHCPGAEALLNFVYSFQCNSMPFPSLDPTEGGWCKVTDKRQSRRKTTAREVSLFFLVLKLRSLSVNIENKKQKWVNAKRQNRKGSKKKSHDPWVWWKVLEGHENKKKTAQQVNKQKNEFLASSEGLGALTDVDRSSLPKIVRFQWAQSKPTDNETSFLSVHSCGTEE